MSARRFLEVAGTHAERLDRLIDDLLELSNIESGRVTMIPTNSMMNTSGRIALGTPGGTVAFLMYLIGP